MTEKQITSIIYSCARPGMYFGKATPQTILGFYYGIELMIESKLKLGFLEYLEKLKLPGNGVEQKIELSSNILKLSWQKCFFDYFIEFVKSEIIKEETKETNKALIFTMTKLILKND